MTSPIQNNFLSPNHTMVTDSQSKNYKVNLTSLNLNSPVLKIPPNQSTQNSHTNSNVKFENSLLN